MFADGVPDRGVLGLGSPVEVLEAGIDCLAVLGFLYLPVVYFTELVIHAFESAPHFFLNIVELITQVHVFAVRTVIIHSLLTRFSHRFGDGREF